MQNHELSNHQASRTESNGNFRSFDYSMNSSYSLHSHFSTSQHIQESQPERNNSMTYSQALSFKLNQPLLENQNPLLQPRQIDSECLQNQTQKSNFLKNKVNTDLLEPQVMNKIIEELTKSQNQKESNPQVHRKTYTSCLHQVVDKNHLESPKRENKNKQELEHIQTPQTKLLEKRNSQNNPYKFQQVPDHKRQSNMVNESRQPYEPVIKPVIVEQKQSETQNSPSSQSPSSPVQSPHQKPKKLELQVRRIPSNLYESYDQLLLTINKNEKALKTDNLISPIKLKEKSNPNNPNNKKSKENQKFNDLAKDNQKMPTKISTILKKTTVDQQLLVLLPVIEGYCQLKTDSSHVFETKFIINKNSICFQTFKTLIISDITKIKFIEKDQDKILIKITYDPQSNGKPQNFIITVLTESHQTYFLQSYGLFSQIILRKLLLMKLCINQLNEKHEVESPTKSPQSSPMSSPLTIPNTISRKPSQNVEIPIEGETIFQSNLFKKSTFFNSWQKKFFALTKNSLQSFTSPPTKGQKSKPSTQLNKTHEIWTRFELVYGYLVIKMWQSKIQKIQIGIPLCDFTNPEGKNNWLFGLSRIIVWRKNNDEKLKITIN